MEVGNEGGGGDQECFEKEFEASATTKATFDRAIKHLRSKVPKGEWQSFPSLVETYKWTLLRVKGPSLTSLIDHVLPPALLLTDNYAPLYKVMGVVCLRHCLDNVDKVDILRNNWAMVIYDALCKLINDKEIEVIEVLGPTLIKVLTFIEENPSEACDKMTKYDNVMKQELFAMEFCSEYLQRIAWMPNLVQLIETMGHATLRWVDRITSMLLSYTISAKPAIWIGVLKIIEVCIKTTWLHPSSDTFADIILRIMFNQSMFIVGENEDDESEDSIEIRKRALVCFELLSHCNDFDVVRSQLQEIDTKAHSNESEKLHPKFMTELKRYNLQQFYLSS